MSHIKDIVALEALYGTPGRASLVKVANEITPEYGAWVQASKFCILTTVGPDGTDGSPRGDAGPVGTIKDSKTLLMPDWRGNNRMDSLRNIVADGRVSLMFMIAGQTNVIRVNGTAVVSVDPDLTGKFDQKGHNPRSVIVISVAEVYSQCARALMRADLWGTAPELDLPTMGEILKAQEQNDFDGRAYDATWADRAKKTMW